jgi:hypothetical protein
MMKDVRDKLRNAKAMCAALSGTVVLLLSKPSVSQDVHRHAAPEKLSAVAFRTTCKPAVQKGAARYPTSRGGRKAVGMRAPTTSRCRASRLPPGS